MKETLEKLVALAKRWRKLSLDYNGWDSQEYIAGDLKVWCYFSDSRNHTSVKLGARGVAVDVAFFSAPIVGGFTVGSVGWIATAIEQWSEFADKQIATFEQRSQEEIANTKKLKRESLEQQLADLGD